MLGPDPISARGTKKTTQAGGDAPFQRYLDKEFLGGEVALSLTRASGRPTGAFDHVETAPAVTNHRIWAAVRRVLFRRPWRAKWTSVPRGI